MELHRYDIIEAELDYGSGSIQKKTKTFLLDTKLFRYYYLLTNHKQMFYYCSCKAKDLNNSQTLLAQHRIK